jgi:CRISPR-associated protein Cmr1
MSIRDATSAPTVPTNLTAWHHYLLGQGLYHYQQGVLRKALIAGEFTMSLVFKRGSTADDRQQIAEAVLAFGLLGGLGSRVRKGFGSVSIGSAQEGLDVPTSRDAYEAALNAIPHKAVSLPPFTALSTQSHIQISAAGNDPLRLLEEAGRQMQLYRSWGRNGRVNGQQAEQRFSADHDLAQAAATNPNSTSVLPERAIFGLPHNYFFSSTRAKLEIMPAEQDRTRRASPLLIHIHQFSNGSSLLVHALLPATFLPPSDRVEFKNGRGVAHSIRVPSPNWAPLHAYLSRFPQAKRVI